MIYDKSTIVFEPLSTNPKFINLSGRVFGRLTVLGYAGKLPRTRWFCECECGAIASISGTNLSSGTTQSCGCLHRERLIASTTTHGLSHIPEYRIWAGMTNRCKNPGNTSYERYGTRGIRVCERWINSFQAFFDDMGERPTPEHSIERIDNNGNYGPENCYWEPDPIVQGGNKRNNRNITFNGETKCIAAWARSTGIRTLRLRLNRGGWCNECALTIPAGGDRCPHRKKTDKKEADIPPLPNPKTTIPVS